MDLPTKLRSNMNSLDNYEPLPFSGCWIYMGTLWPNGYGRWKDLRAHRVSFSRSYGTIPKGLSVLHRCNIKCCINPSHLYLGTALENWKDFRLTQKRRAINNAKLTLTEVQEIRRLRSLGKSQQELADLFSTTQPNISLICSYKSRV